MNDDSLFDQIRECIQCYGDEILPKSFKGAATNPQLMDKIKQRFLRGREAKHPEVPKTLTDEAVLDVMRNYFSCQYPPEQVVDIHKKAMASENIVGDILERYPAAFQEIVKIKLL